MFDLRYHVASLAAVFVALIVGILVGVGLAGSGVNKADLSLMRLQRDNARTNAQAFKQQRDQLQQAANAFDLAYPAVMNGLLGGKRIAVLFVGHANSGIRASVEQTLTDAGADPVVRVISLSVPVDASGLDNVLFNQGPQFVKYVGNDKLESLGNALGSEFATGGQTPLWKVLGKQLIDERNGNLRQRIDGIVVARTVKPQQGDTGRFLQGVYTGVAATGIPVVGVENSNTKVSAVKAFRDRGFSFVDDIDLTTGRAALALRLAGAETGTYGTGDGVDAILPKPASG